MFQSFYLLRDTRLKGRVDNPKQCRGFPSGLNKPNIRGNIVLRTKRHLYYYGQIVRMFALEPLKLVYAQAPDHPAVMLSRLACRLLWLSFCLVETGTAANTTRSSDTSISTREEICAQHSCETCAEAAATRLAPSSAQGISDAASQRRKLACYATAFNSLGFRVRDFEFISSCRTPMQTPVKQISPGTGYILSTYQHQNRAWRNVQPGL